MLRYAKAGLLALCLSYSTWAAAACHVATSSLSFGTYDVFAGTDVRSTATITVTCRLVPPPTVTIAIGAGAHADRPGPRHMAAGSSRLRYNVYRDPALTQVWGDGTGSGGTVTHVVPKNTPWVATLYGRIPAQQNVRAGVYNDTLVVTITW